MQSQGGPQESLWPGQAMTMQTGSGSQDDIKTLWIGDLLYWMDESYLWNCFVHTGEVISVKVIRNKQTGYPEGYGFVEFTSRASAERILQTFNGIQMPQIEQPFRLNWASFGAGEKRDGAQDFSIFVGDLASDVTDFMLNETFRNKYPSVRGAKVVTDSVTGRSKGYGFVRFGDEEERDRAMAEMNGEYCSSRPMRISIATPKKALAGATTGRGTTQGYTQNTYVDSDPTNTTVFVGGLDPSVSDEDLRQIFSQYGELVYVKIPYGKGCGFVQFQTRQSAEDALQKVNGTMIGSQVVRLSWGRNPATKTRPPVQPSYAPPQPDPNAWNHQQAAYYPYAQSYDVYAYGTQDPNLYASYGGYGGYAYPTQQPMVPPMQQIPQLQTQQPSQPLPPTSQPQPQLQHQQLHQQPHAQSQAGQPPQQQAPVQQQNSQHGGSERHHHDDNYDPMAPPDIDRMNANYAAANEQTMIGQQVWMKGTESSVIA